VAIAARALPGLGSVLLVVQAVAEPPGFGAGVDDVRPVRETIDDGFGESGVGEHLGPFAERQVRGDDQAAALVAFRQDLEHELCSTVGQSEVAQLVDIPFDPQAASLMFMLVSRRYERASMIVTSNKPFSAWGEIFGDDMAATAMVDRLIHHAEILSLKGDSYRLKDRDLGPQLGRRTAETA
jgi:hypothetical protein